MTRIAIEKHEQKMIVNILKQYVPDNRVLAFGSRVTGKAKPFSDLDLLILTDTTLPPLTMYNLNHAFEESMLPFKIDLLDSTTISDEFRKIIENEWVPFFF